MSYKMRLTMQIMNDDGSQESYSVTNFSGGTHFDEAFRGGVDKLNLASIYNLMDNAAAQKLMVFGYPPNNITYRFLSAMADDDEKLHSMVLSAFQIGPDNRAILRNMLSMFEISISTVSQKWQLSANSAPIDAIRISWAKEVEAAAHIPVTIAS